MEFQDTQPPKQSPETLSPQTAIESSSQDSPEPLLATQENGQDFWRAIRTAMAAQNQAPTLVSVDRAAHLPLSFGQERLWLLEKLRPDSGLYNLPYTFQLLGPLDPIALGQSLAEILKRHEVLRTAFTEVEGQPVQVITPDLRAPLRILDLQTVPINRQETATIQLVSQEIEHPFDLNCAPLLRTVLIILNEQTHILSVCVHHIIFDGWSEGVFFQELAALYHAFRHNQPSPLSNLSVQYVDFAVWQRNWLQSDALTPSLNYWKQQLAGCSPAYLPTDYASTPSTSLPGNRQTLTLSIHLTDSLKAFSQQAGTTLFTTLLAAFQTLLYRYVEQDEILVCSPIAGRNRADIQPLIGYFNNILPLRCNLSGNPSFREFLDRVRSVTLSAFEHQDTPFQELGNLPDVSLVALSRVLFALLNTQNQPLQLSGLTVKPIHLPRKTADFDLSCFWEEKEEQLIAALEYRTDLFDHPTISEILGNYQALLEAVVADANQSLSSLPLIVPVKVRQAPIPLAHPHPAASVNVPPQTDIERQMAEIWRDVLRSPSVGLTDNFFELGGTSLLALRLFNQIQQTFGVNFPLVTLLQAPTVQQLSKVLQPEAAPISWSPLVALQPQGSKPPFFCVSGLGGNVLYFRDLAHCLGTDQPFYGLQAHGLNGEDTPLATIEEMATFYIQAIRSHQPEGPYFIGGHSFGGMVAFEIARQLVAQGQKVALLAIIDRQGPRLVFNSKPTVWDRMMLKLNNLAEMDRHDQLAYLKKEIVDKVTHFGGKLFPTLTQRRLAHRPKSTVDIIRRANWKALERYEPDVYPGRLTVFLAKIKRIQAHCDPQFGWGGMALEGVEVQEIPGNHTGILKEPSVQVLAEKLAICIDAAIAKDLAESKP